MINIQIKSEYENYPLVIIIRSNNSDFFNIFIGGQTNQIIF